jgi:hypothetical protein
MVATMARLYPTRLCYRVIYTQPYRWAKEMEIKNIHERTIAAPPEPIAALIADFDRLWPAPFGPAPRPRGHGLYQAGTMIWEEFDRPGAARAFRVLEPAELQLEHWFDIEPAAGATVLRHTVEGRAVGRYEAIWRDRIEPGHDVELEAIFDHVETTVRSA